MLFFTNLSSVFLQEHFLVIIAKPPKQIRYTESWIFFFFFFFVWKGTKLVIWLFNHSNAFTTIDFPIARYCIIRLTKAVANEFVMKESKINKKFPFSINTICNSKTCFLFFSGVPCWKAKWTRVFINISLICVNRVYFKFR